MVEQRILAVSPNLPCAMERQEWSLEDYHICKTLYNGYAAQVYTATCRFSGMEVVLKIYNGVDKAPDVAQHEMYREVAIQSGLQHPNVVHLFGAFEEGDTLVLVQEFVPNGDLLALMQSHGGRVDETTVVKVVMRPLLGALMYLHRWGIVHRDVKPENVLFAADGSIKLADFGLAINMVEERPISRVGTLDYMAPEVLQCAIKQNMTMTPGPGSPARYGFATDVWAIGIVTFEMLTGLPPYASDCRYQAESRICSRLPPIFPHSMSPMARDFIVRALAAVPGDRPTIRQLLEHPWIVNPDGCVAAGRPQAHLYPYPHPHPHTHMQQLTQPTTSQSGSATAAVLQPPHPYGYSSEPPLNVAPRAAGEAVQPPPPVIVRLSAASTAGSSPVTLPSHQVLHSQLSAAAATAAAILQGGLPTHPQLYPHCSNSNNQYQGPQPCAPPQGCPAAPAAAVIPPPAPATAVAAPPAPAAAAAISIHQQLRALQQHQLLDLSKLPLEQIQGMIQKLQQAMQLAVAEQQQQEMQQGSQQESMRTAVSGASGVDVAAGGASAAAPGHSRCSGGGGGGVAGASDVLAAASATSPRLSVGGDDVHMVDVAARGGADAVAVHTVPSSCAVVSPVQQPATAAAHSCANSPLQQHHQHHQQEQSSLPGSRDCAAAAGAADSLIGTVVESFSYISTAAGYDSLSASRRTTLEATPLAPLAVLSSDSPTQVSCAQHYLPTSWVAHEGWCASAEVAASAPLPRHTEAGGQLNIAVLEAAPTVVAMSDGGATALASQGGAPHELGDGLIFVSIGSCHKTAGMPVCQVDCPLSQSSKREEGVRPDWIHHFHAS